MTEFKKLVKVVKSEIDRICGQMNELRVQTLKLNRSENAMH